MQSANLFSKDVGGGIMLSWGGVGSQTVVFEDIFGHQLRPLSKEKSDIQKHFATSIRDDGESEGMLGNGDLAKFTIFHGDGQESDKHWLQKSNYIPMAVLEHPQHLEMGFNQPMICPEFPYGEKFSPFFSTYGPQLTGRVMLPLNSATDEGAVFVNAKQYKGIIRRRMYRAKAELKNKALKKSKPYLHLSRHLHAMRRPRGCGGRFLNRKELTGGEKSSDDKDAGGGLFSWPTGSQTTEVSQSNDRDSHSPSSRSYNSISEVTSCYSTEDHAPFLMNHFHSTVFSVPYMTNDCHVIDLESKWEV